MNYDSLVKSELKLLASGSVGKVSINWIKEEFQAILTESKIPKDEILLGSLIGSYAKGSATKYSDIDFKFYTKNFTGDVWFPHKGKIVSIFADRLIDIKKLITSTSDLVWYKELLRSSITIINVNNTKEELIEVVNTTYTQKNISVVNTEIRRVIEYRRKIYSLISKGIIDDPSWHLTYIDFCKKYINNYLACLGYLNNAKVRSEGTYARDISEVLPKETCTYLLDTMNLKLPIKSRLISLEQSYKIFCSEVFKYTKGVT